MIPTLKVQGSIPIKVGNVQIQAATDDVSYAAKQQSTTQVSVSSAGQVLASQASLAISAVSTGMSTQSVIKPSLLQIATSVMTNPKFVVPSMQARTNSVMPSYALALVPIVPFSPTLFDTLAVSTKKFDPYEQLTGISKERPELIMLTGFLPLFTRDVNHSGLALQHLGRDAFMTDAGRFVDLQVQLRALRYATVANIVNNLKQKNVTFANMLVQRKGDFYVQLQALQGTSGFLLNLVKLTDTIKQQLDLRSSLHNVDPQAVLQSHALNYTRTTSSSTVRGLTDIASRFMPATYDLYEMLVRLGYSSENAKQKFSSTKVWLQLLHETRDIIRYHSLEFLDIDTTAQLGDDNPAVLLKSNATLFGLNVSLSALHNLNTLSSTQPVSASSSVKALSDAYAILYQDVHFKTDEARIAALANLVCKEYRYSSGLSQATTTKTLTDYYAYKVVPTGNYTVFDSVLGRFGNNISDVPSAVTNDLASLSQQQPATNVAVLTFESKYLDGDTGTLTPGSVFYVDEVIRTTDGKSFDISRIDSLGLLLDGAYKQFNTLVAGMNVLGTHVADPSDRAATSYNNVLSDPNDFLHTLLSQVTDTASGVTLPAVSGDRLTALYTLAHTDDTTKAALFMYTISKVMRTYGKNVVSRGIQQQTAADNTPLTDTLANQLADDVAAQVRPTATSTFTVKNQLFVKGITSTNLTHDAIVSSLKQGTKLTAIVESMMSKVLAAFSDNNRGFVGDKTRYSGVVDSQVMMAAFDLIIAVVAKYGNQTFTGAHYGTTTSTKNVLTFNVSQATVNYLNSLRDVTNRLEREVALTQQLVYTVLNTLQKLSTSLRSYSNYLTTPSTLTNLKEVSTLIGDPTLFHLTLCEQQVLLLSSVVSDMVGYINANNVGSVTQGLNVDEEVRLLDDSIISPKLRDALYGLLGDSEFATTKGNNKKVLTVGVPLGFTQLMKQRVKLTQLKKSSFSDRRQDVVKLVVYKADQENSDIVYKPITYLFELSRLPVRDNNMLLSLGANPSLMDVVNAVPTRNATQDASAVSLDYASSINVAVSTSHSVAFADESYDFLDQSQKAEILKNHVTSYMMEVYLKLLTGIDVADHKFDMVEPPPTMDAPFIKLLTETHLANVSSIVNRPSATSTIVPAEQHPPMGGVLFRTTATSTASPMTKIGLQTSLSARQPNNSSGTSGNISMSKQFSSIPTPIATPQSVVAQRAMPSASTSLSQLSQRHVSLVLHDITAISGLSRMITPLADPLAVSKKLLKPKQFDRVLNLVVDPDDFEVDYDKTTHTPQGRQALEQMIKRGDIAVQVPGGSHARGPRSNTPGRQDPSVNKYVYRSRDMNEGDLSFEKYFVTVQTFDEEDV